MNDIVNSFQVGWRLEREQGWSRVALVWLGGVAAGALGAGALQPHVRVVGASAAVYALLTAHLPNVCLRYLYVYICDLCSPQYNQLNLWTFVSTCPTS